MGGLYSKIIKAGDRTFFVDVRETRNRSRYLAITETRPSTLEGERTFVRNKVVIPAEWIDEVLTGINEAATLMKGAL